MTLVLQAGAACSIKADGQPIPLSTTSQSDNTTTSGGQSSDPAHGAPRVEHPLDATRFIGQPCAALDQTQLATLAVQKPGIPTTSGAVAENVGPYCSWQYPVGANGSVGSIGVGFLLGNKQGLSDSYRARDEFEYFEPTTVEGYPAVFTDRSDRRQDGECNIVVGISDMLTFRSWESGRLDAQGSCDRAKQVAVAAMTTLKAGG
jgi:hypothetical protein